MLKSLITISLVVASLATVSVAQNTNSSTTERGGATNRNQNSSSTPSGTGRQIVAPRARAPRVVDPVTPQVTAPATPESGTVVMAFNKLLEGIRRANVDAVTGVYWNSPRLLLFNNNGTVTKGWEQMRKNRESSYPDIKDVKLDVRDVSVIMLGRDGAVVSCLWTQSQTYKGTPETASGRMTLVFRRTGRDWKAVHLHTSPDKEDPSRVLPSEQTTPTPAPTPSATPSPTPSPTPAPTPTLQ